MSKKKKGAKGIPKSWILIGLLAAGAYWLYSQATKIMVAGGSFRIHKIGLTTIELRIFLNIINEGRVSIDVQNFIGQVYYGPTALGVVTLVSPVKLPPLQQQQLEFKAELSSTTIGLEIWNIIKSKTPIDTGAFSIKGTLVAEGLSLPINEKLISA